MEKQNSDEDPYDMNSPVYSNYQSEPNYQTKPNSPSVKSAACIIL
jgi:hypothetical protein